MSNSNKIKLLSKKIAASLIKNENSNDFEKPEGFDEKTNAQILSDIKAGKHLNLLKEIDLEKEWKTLKRKIQCSRRPFIFWYYGVVVSVALLI